MTSYSPINSIDDLIGFLQKTRYIQIYGTMDEPIFLLHEILSSTGLTEEKKILQKFDAKCFVSDADRERLGIITVRPYKDGFKRDNTLKLITLNTLLKLIGLSRSISPTILYMQDALYSIINKTHKNDQKSFTITNDTPSDLTFNNIIDIPTREITVKSSILSIAKQYENKNCLYLLKFKEHGERSYYKFGTSRTVTKRIQTHISNFGNEFDKLMLIANCGERFIECEKYILKKYNNGKIVYLRQTEVVYCNEIEIEDVIRDIIDFSIDYVIT